MKGKKLLDPKHLMIIDESEVPAKPKRYTPYREILKRIRRGKALVISEEEARIDTVRGGIKRLQKRGEFTQLILSQMKGEDGIKRLYVVNPSEEKEQGIK